MPIIHFINSKTQTAGGMKNVLAYVTRTEKTKSEDKQYVTALNCNTATAYAEMLATKNAYHKNSGRMYYHLVQSFPKGDGTPPELAHRIAVELAEKVNVTSTYISELERGLKLPSMLLFLKLVEVLNVSADYLVRDAVSTGDLYGDKILAKKTYCFFY